MDEETAGPRGFVQFLLLLSVFVIATCGLVYELISGTLASYLLGDSVTQFSTIIGVYLFSMGIGSYLSRFINRNLVGVFIQVELIIGMVGGCSAALLFLLFDHVSSFRLLLYSMVSLIGILVGLEIPLLMRILKNHFEFKDLVSKIFTFDYVGALIASLLFPLILVPHLGLVRSGFLFGLFNVLVALWTLTLFRREVRWVRSLKVAAILVLIGLMFGFVYSGKILALAEASAFPDEVIYAKSSAYQRIVLTRANNDLRLYLNSNLQFSSRDEYRYHEALVHVGLQAIPGPKHVLVLGGGDGLAVREILKYDSVESVTLVDLDPAMTRLFSTQPFLQDLNHYSLVSPKVHVINSDAFVWLKDNAGEFDFVIVDFPDPSTYSIGKLYTTKFFELLQQHLAPHGAAAIQCTSPYVARKCFWCVNKTLQAVGFVTTPYHVYVPSFGEWGFVLATREPFHVADSYLPDLRFVNADSVRTMLQFPKDMQTVPTEINKLSNQILVRYFEEEWSEYAH
jgi:spermidine synthase